MRNPVFRVSGKARLNLVSQFQKLARIVNFCLNFEASFDMKLSNKQTTKALLRLRRCAGYPLRLVYAFVVGGPPKTGFLASRPII